MALADFASGAQNALQQMIAERIQQQELARRAQLEQQREGRADRQLGLQEDRFAFEQELANRPEPQRPITMSPGGSLVDPGSGRIITAIPPLPEKPERPMSLAPGGSLVDPSSGRIIASMPDRPKEPARSMDDVLAEYEAKKKIDAQYTGSRPSLGAERNTLNFFNRMLEAERNARGAEDALGGRDLAAQQYAPGWLENWLQSDAGQRYTQAQRAFTEARLRKESGAAIPASEFETDRKTNFRIAGDQPGTLKNKRSMRLQTMRGIGNAAGRALQEYYGEGTTLDDLLKEFADEAAAGPTPAAAPAAAGGVVKMRAPDGRPLNVPADKVAEMEALGATRQ